MVTTIENGKYEQQTIIPEEKPKRGRKPNKEGTVGSYKKWARILTASFVKAPYMLGASDGFPEGIKSDEYVFERLGRLFIDQMEFWEEEEGVVLLRLAYKWRKESAARQKKIELEQLKIRTQEDLARIEALEKEVSSV